MMKIKREKSRKHIIFNIRTWEQGAGTLVLGVFFMIIVFFFILMFMEIYQQRENYIETKAATDTIADGTALYAQNNYDASYSDIVNRANSIKSVVQDEVGINVGDVEISEDDFSDKSTITVSADPTFNYITTSFGTTYDIATASGTKFRKYNLPDGVSPVIGSGMGVEVANYALQFVGNPYVWGGISLTNGCDCSGFVGGVYDHFGFNFNQGCHATSSYDFRSVGVEVSESELQPGDIICFSGHVALYIGNNQIVHAQSTNTGIVVSSYPYHKATITRRRLFLDE